MVEFQRVGSVKVENQNLNMYIPQIQGVQVMLRELNNLDENLAKTMRKEIITEIKPLYQTIKSRIPQTTPLSGMNHNGRTSWNKPVRVTGKVSYRKRAGKNHLVSIRTVSAAVEIADMAGKNGRSGLNIGREGSYVGFSAEYSIRGRLQRHRLNNQGLSLINLPKTPSRYIWPAVEDSRSFIVARLQKILDNYAQIVNRKLM